MTLPSPGGASSPARTGRGLSVRCRPEPDATLSNWCPSGRTWRGAGSEEGEVPESQLFRKSAPFSIFRDLPVANLLLPVLDLLKAIGGHALRVRIARIGIGPVSGNIFKKREHCLSIFRGA